MKPRACIPSFSAPSFYGVEEWRRRRIGCASGCASFSLTAERRPGMSPVNGFVDRWIEVMFALVLASGSIVILLLAGWL